MNNYKYGSYNKEIYTKFEYNLKSSIQSYFNNFINIKIISCLLMSIKSYLLNMTSNDLHANINIYMYLRYYYFSCNKSCNISIK